MLYVMAGTVTDCTNVQWVSENIPGKFKAQLIQWIAKGRTQPMIKDSLTLSLRKRTKIQINIQNSTNN